MKIAYVLNETEKDGSVSTIGVFDSPKVTTKKLKEYYGSGLVVVNTLDIRDSGLEWQKNITVDGVTHILTLHYFEINEI